MRRERKGSVRRRRHRALATLCVAAALLLGACAGKHAQPDQAQQAQQQALERARNLCRDFGYTPGTTEFARCAQSEYDRVSQVMPPQVAAPAPVVVTPPVAVPSPAPTPQAAAPQADTGSDDGLIRWLKRPNVCQQAACSAY